MGPECLALSEFKVESAVESVTPTGEFSAAEIARKGSPARPERAGVLAESAIADVPITARHPSTARIRRRFSQRFIAEFIRNAS
jgi:hypothetical protein